MLDIEGTTTPMAFVYEILFPFARAHTPAFLARHLTDADLGSIRFTLRADWEADVERGAAPPPWNDGGAADVAGYVLWLMDRDRKSTGLKALQGEVWRAGYRSGELRGELFPDVAPALRAWHRCNVPVAIFSSGSVTAQRLLFGHTSDGDLTPLIAAYFDTTVGPKREAASYRAIADALERPPAAITFVSDVVEELDAARSAGLRTSLSLRPGNHPQPAHRHPVVRSLDAVRLGGEATTAGSEGVSAGTQERGA